MLAFANPHIYHNALWGHIIAQNLGRTMTARRGGERSQRGQVGWRTGDVSAPSE